MQIIKVNLPQNLEEVELHIGADWHIGDAFCDIDLIKERIDYIKNNKNAYIILNGDLLNNATKTSVSDSYAERITPMDQLNRAISLLEPIKDKIVAITSGNHEDRTWNKEGIDLMRLVAQQLGIEDRYSKTGAFIFLKLGKESRSQHSTNKDNGILYTLYAIHGSGGGRKEGSKAIRLADMASVIDADIYIHSHTHLPMIMKEAYYRVAKTQKTVTLVDKLFVNTASALNYGGYGEKFEYKPNSKDTPTIYLNGTKREIKAKL